MAYKPILFNTEMVQAIMEGRKTQTRRVATLNDSLREFHTLNYPDGWWYEGRVFKDFEMFIRNPQSPRCKYKPGDILWVRETWAHPSEAEVMNGADPDIYLYKADYPLLPAANGRWYPSIHMPKEASRIFLVVKDVWVEQLQDISVFDAINEGCCGTICDHANAHMTFGCTECLNTGWLEPPDAEFAQLWDTTIKPADRDKYGWVANPWVWGIEFERCEKPEGWC